MKNWSPIVKIVVAVLLLICLADMPYGFYQIVRFAAMAAFAYLAYDYFKQNRDGLAVVFVLLALLFQPFFKVSLGRAMWNCVDIVVAIGLFYLIVQGFSKKNKKNN